MQRENNPIDVRASEDSDDAAVMDLLLIEHAGLWSLEEIARRLDHGMDTKDALDRLVAEGLVHRLGGFVFASRAAAKAYSLHE